MIRVRFITRRRRRRSEVEAAAGRRACSTSRRPTASRSKARARGRWPARPAMSSSPPRISPGCRRASEDEEDMLDLAAGASRTSRLSCQIVLSEALDGLTVRMPGREREHAGPLIIRLRVFHGAQEKMPMKFRACGRRPDRRSSLIRARHRGEWPAATRCTSRPRCVMSATHSALPTAGASDRVGFVAIAYGVAIIASRAIATVCVRSAETPARLAGRRLYRQETP